MVRPFSNVFGNAFASSCLAVTVLFLSGCGDGYDIKVYPVSGVVTYKGKPLDNADVVFTTPGKEGQPSTVMGLGKTDAEGRYTIKTQMGPTDTLNGAVEGHHLVTISKYIPPNGMSEEELNKLMRAEVAAMEAKGFVTKEETAPSRIPFLPPKYQNPSASELFADVSAKGENTFNFDLK